ncbi:hypothetical protein ACFQUU_28270 [Herbaspirillum sp. GCM10030257]|uniref:hypothetical protein n=1 Tax=Herbaspirillum sp. GCM10030257 TaxID=3273393 RepID=UPI00361BD137
MATSYQIPNGSKTIGFDFFAYFNRTSVKHEDDQAAQLKKIREQAAPPPPAALLTMEKYLLLGSSISTHQHRKHMADTRLQIDAAQRGVQQHGGTTNETTQSADASVRLRAYSILKNVVKRTTSAMKRTVVVGLASLPQEKAPNMQKAMTTPQSRSERERTTRLIAKGKMSTRTSAQLREECVPKARISAQQITHAKQLLQKAEEEYAVAIYPRAERLQALHACRSRVMELVTQRQALLAQQQSHAEFNSTLREKLASNLKLRPSNLGLHLSSLESDLKKLEPRLSKNEENIVAVLASIVPSGKVREKLPKLMTVLIRRQESLTRSLDAIDVERAEISKLIDEEAAQPGSSDMHTLHDLQGILTTLVGEHANLLADLRQQSTRDTTRLANQYGALSQTMYAWSQAGGPSAENSENHELDDILADALGDIFLQEESLAGKLISEAKDSKASVVKLVSDTANVEKYDTLTQSLYEIFPLDEHHIQDIQTAEDNLERAIALKESVETDVATHTVHARTRSSDKCENLIRDLPGFHTDVASATLRERLHALYELLDTHKVDAKNKLDAHQVFQLAYRAIVDTFASKEGDADPALAIAMLDQIANTSFEDIICRLMGDPNSDLLPSTGKPDGTEAVLQTLAPLRRGMEVIRRITASEGHAQELRDRGMEEVDRAAKVFLIARKARTEYKGTGKQPANIGSTPTLLDAAQKDARKLFYRNFDPTRKEQFAFNRTAGEGVALDAIRNGFTEVGADTDLQYVADKLTKLRTEWGPRAVARAEKATGVIGQGNHAGTRKIIDLAPTTGKTPFSATAFKLASKTSTAYGVDAAKTGAQINDYVLSTSGALESASKTIVQHYPHTVDLLLRCAATKIAKDKIARLKEQGNVLRPEHCEFDETDEASVREEFLKIAGEAGIDITGINTAGVDSISVDTEESDTPRKRLQILLNQVAVSLPAQLKMPLEANSLLQWAEDLKERMGTVPVTKRHPVWEETGKALLMAKRLEDLVSILPAPSVEGVEDIYRYLAAKIEQFQLRGKLRMTGGGVLGVNLKPIKYAIKGTELTARFAQLVASLGNFAVSGTPNIRIEVQYGRNAVFEISMSTVGFEIAIVSETRQSGAIGAGAGVSVGNIFAKGKLGGDKALAEDRILQQGVKFMIPRSVNKEYSDDDMRMETRKLLDLIFQMQITDDGQIERIDPKAFNDGDDVNGVPHSVAQIFAECPHVSPGVIDDMSDVSRKQETDFNASVKTSYLFKLLFGDDESGAIIGGSMKNTHLNSRDVNVSEKTGHHNVERHNNATGGQVAISGGLGGATNAAEIEAGSTAHTLSLGMPGVTQSHQVKLVGKDAKFRLVSVDGKTDAVNTRRDVEYSSVTSLRQSINANFNHWVNLGVTELFKTSEYKKYADAPIAEKKSVVGKHLNDMLNELEAGDYTEGGRRILRNVFAESYRLLDSAAAEYDCLRDEQALCEVRLAKISKYYDELKASGDLSEESMANLNQAASEAHDQRENALTAQNALLQKDDSWIPWKITASERTLENQQKGLNFFARFGVTNTAEGQRPVKSWPT